MINALALALGVQRRGGPGAGLRFDFLTGIYPEPITFSRAGTKYALNASGTFVAFDTDELARTDLGAVIEPAGAGKCLANANGTSTAWNKDAGLTGAAGTSGPIDGINFTTFTRASGNGRINQNLSITSGVTSKVVFVGRGDATFRYAVIRANAEAVGTYRNYVFDTQALSVQYQGTGSTGPEIVALADGFFMASLEITAGHTGTSGHYFYLTNVEPTNDTFAAPSATGTWDFAYGDVLTQGSESLIISVGTAATRNADALTLPLGSGTQDLVFTFDDDTTQTFAGETGDFAVPTNLDRPRVKYADWGAV